VRIGRQGARGSGFTIRFIVDPRAREGIDFVLSRVEDHLIFRNKSALKVIPESLNLGPVEYFELLANNQSLNSSDRGIFEKLRRRINHKSKTMTGSELERIHEIIIGEFAKIPLNENLLTEWFQLEISQNHWSDLLLLLENSSSLSLFGGIINTLSKTHPDSFNTWIAVHRAPVMNAILKIFKKEGFNALSPIGFRPAAMVLQQSQNGIDINETVSPATLEEWKVFMVLLEHKAGLTTTGMATHILQRSPVLKQNSQLLDKALSGLLPKLYKQMSVDDVRRFHEIFLSAPASAKLTDWQALALLGAQNKDSQMPLDPEFYFNTPIWKSRTWSNQERKQVLQILQSPNQNYRLWNSIYFLAQKQTEELQRMGLPTLHQAGMAWKLFKESVRAHLPGEHMPPEPKKNLLEVMDPSRWDRDSIRELRTALVDALEYYKQGESTTRLMTLLSLPITWQNLEFRQMVIDVVSVDGFLSEIALTFPQWLEHPEPPTGPSESKLQDVVDAEIVNHPEELQKPRLSCRDAI
jgi:hypothetical protein